MRITTDTHRGRLITEAFACGVVAIYLLATSPRMHSSSVRSLEFSRHEADWIFQKEETPLVYVYDVADIEQAFIQELDGAWYVPAEDNESFGRSSASVSKGQTKGLNIQRPDNAVSVDARQEAHDAIMRCTSINYGRFAGGRATSAWLIDGKLVASQTHIQHVHTLTELDLLRTNVSLADHLQFPLIKLK